ncbi:YqaJ viral recombinase family protein, partial [candidate division KSB1 bacterium]|nr:YqaJ viral recombinase family protein [candidate division KSB1 bacterium]
MRYIPTKDLDFAGWLDVRRKYIVDYNAIGGSSAGAVLGLCQRGDGTFFETPGSVYRKIVEGEETPDNARMKRGRMLEDVVVRMFEEETGLKTRNDFKIRIHDSYDWAIGDYDRMVVSHDDLGPSILEVKTTDSWVYKTWLENYEGIPPYQLAQCQHYMWISGHNTCYWAVLLVDTWELHYHRIHRDDDYLAAYHVPRLQNFVENHLQKRVPPPPLNENDARMVWGEEIPGKYIDVGSEDFKELLKAIHMSSVASGLDK